MSQSALHAKHANHEFIFHLINVSSILMFGQNNPMVEMCNETAMTKKAMVISTQMRGLVQRIE